MVKFRSYLAPAVAVFCLPFSQLFAQEQSYQLTIEPPDHGRLQFNVDIPPDGMLPTGTMVEVRAEADSGYALDTVFSVIPGAFGRAYRESQTPTHSFVMDQDVSVGALFLPEEQLSGFEAMYNIVYAQPGVKPLKYDVYMPDTGAENLPIVVIIHGGGWRANNEDIMRGMAREIASTQRYVVASIDYRWIGDGDGDQPPNDMADLIKDVFGAIAHIQEHAAEYGGDPNRIAVTGDSAGGHLSAAAATMSTMIGDGGFGEQPGVFEYLPSYLPNGVSAEQLNYSITNAIQAAAPSYGIFSSRGERGLSHRSEDSRADQSWSDAIAPINHVPDFSERAVPHYLTRGTRDRLITDTMVTEYVMALGEKNQRVRYDQVPGAGHAFFDWKPDQRTLATFDEYGRPYIREMVSFFDSVFYPEN